MTKKRIIIFSLVVLIFLAVGSYVLAQPTDTEATLLVTAGDVAVLQPQGFLNFNNNQQTNLTAGDILIVRQGDTIDVASAASAVLTMGDGTSADLFPGTVVEVSELFSDETNFRVRLTLLAGKTVNRVQHLLTADDAYDVQTPSSTASVRGTVFTVDVISDQETFYSVDEGFVAVQMGEQEVLVEAGFEVTAVTGQALIVQPQSANVNQSRETIETAVDGQTSIQPTSVDASDADDSTSESAENQPESANTSPNQDSVSGVDNDQDGAAQTAVSTETPTATKSNPNNSTATATATPVPGGSTSAPPTVTSSAPTATRVGSTATRVPPTATRIVPTSTRFVPTATRVVPTNTVVPPTAASVPPTNTPVPPPPPTATPVPPPPPTNTPEPPPPPTDEPKVTLCHNGNTISVDPSSVQSHLDHGDYLGACN